MVYWRSWARCLALPEYQFEEVGLLARLIPLGALESLLPSSERRKFVLESFPRRYQLGAES
jgi:hypothetical protein